MTRFSLPLLVVALIVFNGHLPAQPPMFGGGQKNVSLELLTDKNPVAAGDTVQLLLKMDHAPGWNTYWLNPGTGLATELEWTLPDGYEPEQTLWPIPKVKDAGGDVGTNHIYVDTIHVITPVKIPADAAEGSASISVKVNWLECDINGCAPSNGSVSVDLAIAGESVAREGAEKIVNQIREEQPMATDAWKINVEAATDVFHAVLTPGANANSDPGDIYFFESTETPQLAYLMPEVTEDGAVRILKMKRTETDSPIEGFFYASNGWSADGKTKALSLPSSGKAAGGGNAAAGDGGEAEFVTLDGKAEKKLTVGRALFLAFIGGLLLNLMPCVFPVLGIKIMGFVQQAGDDPAKIKVHGFVFAAGLVLSLWILAGILVAVNLAGKQMGWGFQLSSPGFLAFIIILLFLMALNLFGVFEIGTTLMGVGSQTGTQKGYSGSFWSGVLTTLIATPCSGPFLGTTMGFTLQQSIPIAFLIFTALALGIAAPYVILSLNPNLIKKLPKPGGWMITFKKVMAFPLLATVIYFLNAFAHQQGREGLITLLVCLLIAGIAAWVYGSWCTPAKAKATRLRGLIATLLISIGAFLYGRKALAGNPRKNC